MEFSSSSSTDRRIMIKVKKGEDTWMGGVYTLIRSWKEGKGIGKESIESLPIWVSLPRFPKHLWDTPTFSSIGSVLGIPLRVDAYTAKAPNDDGARLLVKMDASGDFPCEVPIFIQEGDSLVVEEIAHVHYARPPPKCIRCKIFGHWTSQCIYLQRVAGEGNQSSKFGLEKMDEQETKESYQSAHNKLQNKEKRPNKEKLGMNSGWIGGNKENGSMNSSSIGMVGKDNPTDLSNLGFVGESLGGKGVGDDLRVKKSTLVGDRVDKGALTNPTNLRVTTKKWVTKAAHTSTMDIDPPSLSNLGDPNKDPTSKNGGSDKDPIIIIGGSDKMLSGSNNEFAGSESENIGSIIGSAGNPIKDPFIDPDSEMEESRVDASNNVGDVDKRQGQVSKVLGNQPKDFGEVSKYPPRVGELPKNLGELDKDPPSHIKRYSRKSRMGGGLFCQGRIRQMNSGSRAGTNSGANSSSGASLGANSGPSGSSRASSRTNCSSPGSSRARSGSSSCLRASSGSPSSSRASSCSRLSSRANDGPVSSSGASTGSSSSFGSSSGSRSRTSLDPENSSRSNSGFKDSPENNSGGNRKFEETTPHSHEVTLDPKDKVPDQPMEVALTRENDPVMDMGICLTSDSTDPTSGDMDEESSGQSVTRECDPIDEKPQDPLENGNGDPIEGKEWYQVGWPYGNNDDEMMSDTDNWDKDKVFRVDLSNKDVHQHVSQKEWPNRWKACTEELVMGKTLKVEEVVQGGPMTEDENSPPTQLIRTPWDEGKPGMRLRQERSYKEFAEDLQRKAKNREVYKEKGKGKLRGPPKEENVKYLTSPCEYTESGDKGKRTPDGQRRGDVKRRKAMAVLVTEALVELGRSDDMCH
ncbi:hypothetical protein ZOSMA_127G00270 [Zostera marina]|uniref:Uncharacterized protein n=1 Tax=Zostera marina TaxID=29655 RepID=A0A0K9PZQ1_ZOSMR|nr:hypothetical protein ZOSMA_127G00270 [Zostera marina]